MEAPKVIIEAKGLVKEFRLSKKQRKLNRNKSSNKVAVNNLSFNVCEGEIFGLLGPNGAGKTTTLRMLSTLVKPTKGDAIINGHSVSLDPETVRKNIGFLTSEFKLEDYFTPEYLFDFFSELYSIPKSISDNRKNMLFKKFGIDDYRETKIGDLSTGMKQKVSLVISIVHDPKVIIFDEPTNGLDIVASKIVIDFLMELKSMGKTIIISTHIFELIEKLCDRVAIIIDGKLVVCDRIESLTSSNSLETVFFNIYDGGVYNG